MQYKVINPADPLHKAVDKLTPQQKMEAFGPSPKELEHLKKAKETQDRFGDPLPETEADSRDLLKRRYAAPRILKARLDQTRVSSLKCAPKK